MLKLCPDVISFHAPVFISVAGNPKPVRIEAEFKFMGRKALQEYFDGIADKKDVEALSEILLGWKGVEAEFSPEALEKLLDSYPSAGGSFFEAFRKEVFEAKEKNSGR